MKIIRTDCRWRILAFRCIVHDCLESLALEKGYRVSAVCDALGMSDRHLRDLFLRDVGLLPKEWMQWERMVVARRMMVRGVDPLEVSAKIGFSDINSFRREFRAVYGVTPSRFLELRLPDDL